MKMKKMYKRISKNLILVLLVIALSVFIGQLLHLNCWLNICLYWLVLTIKNYFDWKGTKDE